MRSKNKPVGEILAGFVITGAAVYISVKAVTANPSYADALFITVPLLIVGLIVLLSDDATKAGKTIYRFFVRL